jgi:hypothetical protein
MPHPVGQQTRARGGSPRSHMFDKMYSIHESRCKETTKQSTCKGMVNMCAWYEKGAKCLVDGQALSNDYLLCHVFPGRAECGGGRGGRGDDQGIGGGGGGGGGDDDDEIPLVDSRQRRQIRERIAAVDALQARGAALQDTGAAENPFDAL